MNLPPAPTVIGRICVDLDGTLARSEWPSPEIGEPIDTGVNIVLAAIDEGYEVIIYTARPASHSHRIWEWLKENGLYGVVYDVVCGKPTADLYVDDKAYNPFSVPASGAGESLGADFAAWQEQGAGAAPPGKDQGPTQSKAAGSNYIGDYCGVPCYVDENQKDDYVPFQGEFGPIEEPDDAWVDRALRWMHG